MQELIKFDRAFVKKRKKKEKDDSMILQTRNVILIDLLIKVANLVPSRKSEFSIWNKNCLLRQFLH